MPWKGGSGVVTTTGDEPHLTPVGGAEEGADPWAPRNLRFFGWQSPFADDEFMMPLGVLPTS